MKEILEIVTVGFTLINLVFYSYPLLRLNREHEEQKVIPQKNKAQICVLIAAYNEEENLKKNLPFILNQVYENYKVVVVNDNSTDGSYALLETFAEKHKKLSIIHAQPTEKGKKGALTQALKQVTEEWILVTDADCIPASSYWISDMANSINNEDTKIVLGYSPYKKQALVVNSWIRFEAVYTAIQYLSAAILGRPYMGVGRNMMYHKSIYESSGGFSKHQHLAGGDDDLLINANANARNTKICTTKRSWVYTEPHDNWKSYIRQKKRHLSVSTSYKLLDQIWLGVLSLSHLVHYLGIFCCLFIGSWELAAIVYLLRLSIVWIQLSATISRLGQKDLSIKVPLFDFALFIYYIRFSFAALLPNSGKSNW